MKIAISVPDDLFKEIERFAEEYDYSRSEVFVMAVREFLEKLKSQKIMDALNAAYTEAETGDEKKLRQAGKEYYKRKILRSTVGNPAG